MGVRLLDDEPPEDGRRGLSRPPWLSAQDAYRGVDSWPQSQDGLDHDDPGLGHGAAGDAAPLPSSGPTKITAQGPEQHDLRSRSSEYGRSCDPVELDPALPRAPKSAETLADLDANVDLRLMPEENGHRLSEPGPADGDGFVKRSDPRTGEIKPDDVGQEGADCRTGDRNWLPDELHTKELFAQRMSLPLWETRPSMEPAEIDHLSADEAESSTAHPVARPGPDSFDEPPPRPQGSGLLPPGVSLPPLPLPPPPGWPPGIPLVPAGWLPPGSPGWPPLQPGAPLPEWQYDMGDRGQAQPARSHPPVQPEVQRIETFRVPPSLEEATVADPRTYAPRSGWRRAVHRATGGHINLGDSRKDRAQEDLLSRIRQPILGDFRIAVLSIKGGVGKTTTTLGLGSAFALVRRDRVIAVDANPDRGTLAERVSDISTNSTVRDLLTDPNINRYADVRGHTRMAVSRLEVLASEQDPAAAEVFDEADYRRTIAILGQYYNVVLTDCGTGIMHSAMAGVLELAHSIVLVSAPAIDALRSASATLDWLMQHGHSRLVRQGHVVLSAARPGSAALKLDKVCEFFEARCQSIHVIPFDPHLAEGADVDFEILKSTTRQAYLGLAGSIAENFPRSHAARP